MTVEARIAAILRTNPKKPYCDDRLRRLLILWS